MFHQFLVMFHYLFCILWYLSRLLLALSLQHIQSHNLFLLINIIYLLVFILYGIIHPNSCDHHRISNLFYKMFFGYLIFRFGNSFPPFSIILYHPLISICHIICLFFSIMIIFILVVCHYLVFIIFILTFIITDWII